MSDLEKLQYAKARLSLAKMMGDAREVEKWREHVAHWESRLTQRAADGACTCAPEALGHSYDCPAGGNPLYNQPRR